MYKIPKGELDCVKTLERLEYVTTLHERLKNTPEYKEANIVTLLRLESAFWLRVAMDLCQIAKPDYRPTDAELEMMYQRHLAERQIVAEQERWDCGVSDEAEDRK